MVQTEKPDKSKSSGDLPRADGLSPQDDPFASKLPSLTDSAKDNIIQESKDAFYNRRRIQISAIPVAIRPEELGKTLLKDFVFEDIFIDARNNAHVLLSTSSEAKKALSFIKGKRFKENILGASYSQNEFLLFIGNISYSLSIEKFKDMLKQYGEIERIFIMHSEETGQSKGYGFVEYKKNSAITVAKRELAKNHKNLKVELSSAGLFEYYDFQSQTLSVSRFPSNTTSEQIEEIITKHVQVPFCRIPTNTKTGKLEDFALVDCKSPEDAEMLWKKLDGSAINSGHMRIKFNSPGRLASTLFGGQSFKTFTPKVEPKSPQAVKNVRATGPQARPPRPDNPARPANFRSPTTSNSQRPFQRPPNGQSPQHPLGMRLPRHSGGPRAPRDPLQLRGPRGPAVGPRLFRPPGWRPPFRGPRPRLDSPFAQGIRPRPPFRPRGPEMRFRGPLMRPRPPFQEEWTFSEINYEQDEFQDDPSGDRDDHHSSQAIEGSYFEEKGSAPHFPVPKLEDNGDRRQVGFQRGGNFDRNEDHQRMESFERQHDFSDKQRDFPGRPRDLNPNRDRNQKREFSNEEKDFADQRRDFPGERRDFRDGRRFPDQERDVPDQRRPFPVGSMDARRDFPDRRRDIADNQRDFPHERRDFAEKQREFPDRHGGFEEHRRFDGQGEFGIGNSTQEEQRGLANFEDPRKDVGFRGDKDRRDDIQDRGSRPPFGEYERESAFPPRQPHFADNNMQRTEANRPFGHEPPRELQKEPQKPWMRRGPPEREIPPNQPRNDDQRQPLNQQPVINEPHPDKREPFDQRQPGRWQEHNTNEFMHQRNVLPDDAGRRMEIAARPLLQQGKPNQIRPSFNAASLRQEEPKFDARHQPSDRFPHQGTPKPLPEPGRSQGLLQDPAPETMIRPQIALGQPGPRESRPPPLGMAPPRFQSPQPLLQQPQQPPQQPMGNVQPSQVFPRFPWQQPLPQQPPSQQTLQQQSPLQQPPPQQPPFQQPPPQQPPFQQPPPQQPSFQQPPPQQPPFQQPPPQHLPTSQPEQYLPPTFPPQHPPLNPNSYFNPVPPVAHAPKTSAQPTTPQYAIAQGPGKQWMDQSTSHPSGPITTATTFSSNLTGSIPSIPNMPAFHMPAPAVPLLPVASGVQQPARVSNASVTASLPASGPPLVAGAMPQANPQLDTYVAAASAAQQYAQYYQQLAKQQESIAQQPTAAGSKEASTLASQATAYAQYYQQYYQHMQHILQITKVPPTSLGQQQQHSSTTVAVSQPSPSVSVQGANQLPAALQLPQSLQAPHQIQQHQLLPASSAMSSLSLQQQRMPPPQWQPQMAPGLLQQPPPQAFGTQPAINNQQGVPLFPPKTSLPIQGQISSQPQQAWQMHVPPMQQATATGQSPASPFQSVPQRPQIQPLMSQLQQPPRASNPQSPWVPGAAQSTQPPQPQGSAQRMPVQSPQAQTGMNWMFSKTETTDTVQPQHFSKPVLYTAQTAPDQHGDKRQNQSLFPYSVTKRPRY